MGDENSRNPPRPTNRLTWVNYVNPQQERKTSINKAIVRKVAKLSTLPGRSKTSPTVPVAGSSTAQPDTDNPTSKPEGELNREPPSPILLSGNSDPFDSLPLQTKSWYFFLLNRYCERAHLEPSCRSSCPQVQQLRQTYLVPTFIRSPGALHAALFHIERRWKLQNESEHDAFQSAQQLGAIVELQRNLQRGDALVAIEAFVVIGKLCSAAIFAKDPVAEAVHYNGMASLFQTHWSDLASHPLFVLGVFAFWCTMQALRFCAAVSANSSYSHIRNTCCNDPKAMNSPLQLAQHTGQEVAPPEVQCTEMQAFRQLQVLGLISPATLGAIPRMVRLAQLIKDARTKSLTTDTAKELLQLKWQCSTIFQTLESGPQNDFERILLSILQLIITLCINPEMQAVGDFYCPAIVSQLSNMDLDPTLEAAPEVLLWMSLAMGSCSINSRVQNDDQPCVELLKLVSGKMQLTSPETALTHARTYIWTPQLDDFATQFWLRVHDVPGTTLMASSDVSTACGTEAAP